MKSQSLSSELREVLSVLTESPIRYHRGAVLTIITSLRNVEVNNFVALRYLRAWAKEKRESVPFLRDTEPLRALHEVLDYGVSPYVAKRALREALVVGWHETSAHIAGRFLHRNLTSDEVHTLILAYVNDRGSRSSADEKKLVELARKRMTEEDARIHEEMINKFVQDFEQAD